MFLFHQPVFPPCRTGHGQHDQKTVGERVRLWRTVAYVRLHSVQHESVPTPGTVFISGSSVPFTGDQLGVFEFYGKGLIPVFGNNLDIGDAID